MELRKFSHLTSQPIHLQWHFQKSNTTLSFQKLKQNISQIHPFILLAICLGVVLIATIIVVICCRKYHTRQMYQQSPQNFTSRPNLSFAQRWRLDSQVKSLTKADGHSIIKKQTYDGKYLQVTFKTNHNCIYFPNELSKDCYFEIEIVKLSSIIQIGFVHRDDLNQICKEIGGQYQINLDNYGISVRTDGTTFIYGNNQLNFPWKIQYGDTLGIGITQHDGGRRVWITKNGIIQNPPSEQEKIKYLDVDKQKNKGQTTVKKQKKVTQDSDQQDERKRKQKQQAAKRRIQIRGHGKFRYYAVIISESPTQPLGQTILNWNVGGQNFRLYDAKQLKGLLR